LLAELELDSIKNSIASGAYINTVGTRNHSIVFRILPVTR
jgi:hypothetical protein